MLTATKVQLEELGARTLPSATITAPILDPVAPIVIGLENQHHNPGGKLNGDGGGNYLGGVMIPDAGAEYRLYGSAFLGKLGEVTLSGTIASVGFTAEGHAGGELTFRNEHGSVTIEIWGKMQPGFSKLPEEFHYKVIDGTGAYKHFHDHGQLKLDLHSNSSDKHPGGDFTIQIEHPEHHFYPMMSSTTAK